MSDRPDPRTEQQETRQVPFVRVDDTRAGVDAGSRTAPRMRVDVLQLVAWVLGLYFLVAGLVALARAGFDELGLFEPVVQVGGLPATPLWALLQLVIGIALLAGSTGEVRERGLRIGAVLLGVVGAVWLIEPDAFNPWLGVVPNSGATLLTMGVVLVAASFVPPLSVRRPGIRPPDA